MRSLWTCRAGKVERDCVVASKVRKEAVGQQLAMDSDELGQETGAPRSESVRSQRTGDRGRACCSLEHEAGSNDGSVQPGKVVAAIDIGPAFYLSVPASDQPPGRDT